MDNIKYYNDKSIEYIKNDIINYIENFKKPNSFKYLYVYGENGIGKTSIVKNILESLNYYINYVDCNYNKSTLDELINITNNKDVYSMFFNNVKNTALIVDNINYYLHNDKSYFNNLIKLLKKKKNNLIPLIFITTIQEEKKFIELSKISYKLKIVPPSNLQLETLIIKLYPNIIKLNNYKNILANILKYLNNKYYKIVNLNYYYKNNLIELQFDSNITINNNNNNIKILTKKFLENNYTLKNLDIINYSDRTSLSLLIHENIQKLFNNNLSKNDRIIYKKILENFIFSDCIDKNIFLHQIWQLNDILYIIKIFYNNYILSKNNLLKNISLDNIIFTKILTKYSSEYNNFNFIFNNTQLFCINKKNLFLHIVIINNNTEIFNKLVYNRFIKLIQQYNNYKLNNNCKIIEDCNDIIVDELFH